MDLKAMAEYAEIDTSMPVEDVLSTKNGEERYGVVVYIKTAGGVPSEYFIDMEDSSVSDSYMAAFVAAAIKNALLT